MHTPITPSPRPTHRAINPWTWQQSQGWSWGMETTGPQRTLYCSGQVAVDARGKPLHAGDIGAQTACALDHLETVLQHAGYTLADLVRIDYYTTDADALMRAWHVISDRLVPSGCVAGGVLLQVSRLALPELMIEIQAIACRPAGAAGA